MNIKIKRGVKSGLPYFYVYINGEQLSLELSSQKITSCDCEKYNGIFTEDASNIIFIKGNERRIFKFKKLDHIEDLLPVLVSKLRNRLKQIKEWVDEIEAKDWEECQHIDLSI